MKLQLFKLSFMLIFISAFSFAQVRISGKILFKNKPVSNVNVTLKDTYDGATSDADGNYSFETSEKGAHILLFSTPNFSEVEKSIEIKDEPIVLNIDMKEQVSEISAVVITAGSIEASDKKRATAALTPMDIYQTAGANGVMSEGYKFLPGVQKAGESEGLFVRGGTGVETKFYMDGNLVNNYFSASVPGIPGRDRFNTNIFKASSFSSGGYSALYGQALSAVLLLESIDLPEKTSYNFSVMPFSANADFQKLNDEKTFSYGLEAHYTNFNLMAKLLKYNTIFIKYPESFGVNGNFRKVMKNGGFLKYYGSFDTNSLKLSQPSLEQNYDEQQPAVKGKNTFQSLSYKQKFGKYQLNLGASFTAEEDEVKVGILNHDNPITEVLQKTNGTYFNQKSVLERKIFSASNIKAGYELQYSNDIFKNQAPSSQEQKREVTNLISAVFAETNLALTTKFSFSGGIRAEYSSYLKKWNLAPRLAAAYKLSPNWVTSAAFGEFYQNSEARYVSADYRQPFQKATHYIWQLERNESGRTLRGEVFYKKYEDLEKSINHNFITSPSAITGNGFAKGAELLWRDKKTIENLDYSVSYSFLDSKRNYLNYPTELAPSFASKHTVSVSAKKFFVNAKTGIGVSYQYASPRPFYNIVYQNGLNVLLGEGKTKDYNSLNINGFYLPNLGKKDAKSFTILIAGVNNVLNSKNVFGYRFSQDGLRSTAVIPPSNMMFYVGAIFNFGVDKTQDTIDNL